MDLKIQLSPDARRKIAESLIIHDGPLGLTNIPITIVAENDEDKEKISQFVDNLGIGTTAHHYKAEFGLRVIRCPEDCSMLTLIFTYLD